MEEALNFINEQGQDLILKPMMGGAAAKHLSEVSLENAFSNYTACTLQQYVRGTIAESFIFRVTAQSLYWLKLYRGRLARRHNYYLGAL